MAYYDTTWYCNAGDQATTGHYAVTKWAASASVAAGVLRRQLAAPTVGNERVFVCIVAGTTGGSEPTWIITRGAKTTDNTLTWMEVTGASAVNGDATNTANWTTAKAIGAPTLGAIIKRNNGASYQICTTAGAMGASEPAFSDTAGVTTTDSSAVWTSLGVVGSFTGGQAPHARLANACASTWFAAGNTIYVGDNHAETQASAISIGVAQTVSTIGKILCHNHSGSYPPTSVMAGASIATTGANNLTITAVGAGGIYCYGIAFLAGSAANSCSVIFTTNIGFLIFEACLFKLNTTYSAATIALNGFAAAGSMVWNNCTVFFGHVNQYFSVGDLFFTWQNTGPILASGSVVPASLLYQPSNGCIYGMTLEALDLSQLTGALLNIGAADNKNILIKDCKLNAAVTIGTPGQSYQTVQLVRSDSAATGYKSARYTYEGTETTETSITRVGGAADPTGQAQSRKIVTTANSQWLRPFKAEPYAIWNAVTGSNVRVTVCGTINSGSLPLNDELFLEVEYLGSSASPLGTIVTTTKSNLLAANAAVASDGSSWNGTSTPPPTTWNASDKSANFLLSGGNLTAGTNSSTDGAVRSSLSQATGKFYFEVAWATGSLGGDTGCGIATGSASLGMGTTSAGGLLVYGTGQIYFNGVNQSINIGSSASAVVCFAIDLINSRAWARTNGGTWNGSGTADPATNTGGVNISGLFPTNAVFAVVTANQTANPLATVNFGASTFAQSAPSGFPAWNSASVWTPFKLTTTLSSPQPGMAGYIHARVRAAKPSTTYYIDPQIVLS